MIKIILALFVSVAGLVAFGQESEHWRMKYLQADTLAIKECVESINVSVPVRAQIMKELAEEIKKGDGGRMYYLYKKYWQVQGKLEVASYECYHLSGLDGIQKMAVEASREGVIDQKAVGEFQRLSGAAATAVVDAAMPDSLSVVRAAVFAQTNVFGEKTMKNLETKIKERSNAILALAEPGLDAVQKIVRQNKVDKIQGEVVKLIVSVDGFWSLCGPIGAEWETENGRMSEKTYLKMRSLREKLSGYLKKKYPDTDELKVYSSVTGQQFPHDGFQL